MKKRILAVVTNQGEYKNGDPTGLWLGELVHFYEVAVEAGYSVDLASPKGGTVPLDPVSILKQFMDPVTEKYFQDKAFMAKLNASLELSKVNSKDYMAVYFTGGHGTMWDFLDDKNLQKIAVSIYENQGYVVSVCHGAAALINLKLSDGTWLIQGKKLTGFSNHEEEIAHALPKINYSVEDSLKEHGALYEIAEKPLVPFTVTDGHLITGQNPASALEVAKAFVKAAS